MAKGIWKISYRENGAKKKYFFADINNFPYRIPNDKNAKIVLLQKLNTEVKELIAKGCTDVKCYEA